MSRGRNIAAALKRGVLGGVAGAVVGVILLVVVAQAVGYYPPNDQAGSVLFVAGSGVGGALGAVLGLVAGAWEIRGVPKSTVVGVLAGCVLALAFIVVVAGVASALQGTDLLWGKRGAGFRVFGIVVGVPAFSLLGGVVGFSFGLMQRRREPPP